MIKESQLERSTAVFCDTVLAGDYYIKKINKGQMFRILDLEGNQAADTLFYCADNTAERYSAIDTIRETRLFGVLKNIRRQLRKSRNSSDPARAGGKDRPGR